MFLADFHTHSCWSDGKLPIPALVDLYGKRGFGALAITDHLCESTTFLGRISRYIGCSLTEANFGEYTRLIEKEKNRAWRDYRMLVLPGFEVTKNFVSNQRSAHVLALGLSRYVDPCLPIPELCAAIRAEGGLAIAAHPVSTRKLEKQTFHLWDRREELRTSFDAWEVASGPYLFNEVLQSGLPMIATSDLHHPRQISAWKTVLRCEKSPEAVLEAIRRQELSFAFYQEGNRACQLNGPRAFSPFERSRAGTSGAC